MFNVPNQYRIKNGASVKEQIKELALRCGFKLRQQENGEMDLNPNQLSKKPFTLFGSAFDKAI